MNEDIIPNYSNNRSKNLFTVVTAKGDDPNMITETFEDALKKDLIKYKLLAQNFEGFDDNVI